jgi:putative endonuclease
MGLRKPSERVGALTTQRENAAERIAVGRAGEAVAAALLRSKGLEILARNWRHGRFELDLVCADGETLVFVEVKTRQAEGLAEPADALTTAKRRALAKAAQAWLSAHAAWQRPCRFDVVCVLKRGLTFNAEHYCHAFDFSPALGSGHTAWQPW